MLDDVPDRPSSSPSLPDSTLATLLQILTLLHVHSRSAAVGMDRSGPVSLWRGHPAQQLLDSLVNVTDLGRQTQNRDNLAAVASASEDV
jgi:hypothetical protein